MARQEILVREPVQSLAPLKPELPLSPPLSFPPLLFCSTVLPLARPRLASSPGTASRGRTAFLGTHPDGRTPDINVMLSAHPFPAEGLSYSLSTSSTTPLPHLPSRTLRLCRVLSSVDFVSRLMVNPLENHCPSATCGICRTLHRERGRVKGKHQTTKNAIVSSLQGSSTVKHCAPKHFHVLVNHQPSVINHE